MKIRYTFLLIPFFVFNLLAKNTIDSLKQNLNQVDGKAKIEVRIELAKRLIDRTKIAEALKYAKTSLSESKKLEDKQNTIISYSVIGKGYLISGDLQNAKAYADSAMVLSNIIDNNYGRGLAKQIFGTIKVYSGEMAVGLSLIDSTLAIFQKENKIEDQGVSNLLIGSILASVGKADSSLIHMKNAEELFKKSNNEYRIATVKLNQGMIQSSFLGQYENSISNSLESLTYFEDVEDTNKICVSLGNIATCYDAIGNYDRAIEYYRHLLTMTDKDNLVFNANFYNNFGEVYKHKGEYDSAKVWYEKSLEIYLQLGITEGVIVAKNNLGECLYFADEYDKALKYYQESLADVDKKNDHYKLAILYKNIGNVYLAKNQNDRAIRYFNLSIKSGNALAMLEEVFPAYESLAKAYKNKGQYRKAYDALEQYAEVKNKYLENSNAERLTDKEIKYQSQRKEKEIELLTKDKKIQSLEIASQEIRLIALIILVLFAIVLALILFKKNRDHKKLNAALSEKNEKIKIQAQELKEANKHLQSSEADLKKMNATKDKFFSIIAHDLKGPFSSLIGLSDIMANDIETLTPEEIKEMGVGMNNAANKVFSLAENLLEWSRTQLGIINVTKLSFDFNEIVEENIRLYNESIQEKNLKIKNELCSNSMISADKDMINFTLRNLLSNAIKFTNEEGEIIIKSCIEDNDFVVSVSDNGKGIQKENIEKLFDIESTFTTQGTKEEKGTGLGLILAKEFVEKNGGSLSVSSEVNMGSTFVIKIPKN